MDGASAISLRETTPAQARRATLEDVPFLVSLARICYPDRALEHAAEWAERLIKAPEGAIFFCSLSCVTVAWQSEFWEEDGRRVADVLPAFSYASASDPLALLKCYRAAIAWARGEGCYGVRFGSSLGARAKGRDETDLFKSMAQRLGAKRWGVTYMVEV